MAIVTAHVNAVQQLYVAYFNRPADYAGLDYWTNIVAAQKGSTAAVSAAFAAEAEYKTAYANMTNAQVVNQVYQNLFGRAAETAGQNYWADLLDRKVITIDKVVADIAKGAQGTDAEAYENKVAGATAFSAALDTKAEQDGYRGAEANKLAKAFITSITTDASLTVATAPATLNATVAKVVIAGTPFTLQSGLSALQSAQEAKTAFLDAADGKVDQKLVTEASITDKVATTTAAIDTYIAGFSTTTSAGVKAALLADKVTSNNAALAAAQMEVAEDQVAIAKVAGLANAIAADAAAEAAVTAAQKALTLATADQAAKEAAFESLTGTTITVNANGTVAGLIKLDSSNKLVVESSAITETAKPGITALLAAVTANQAAIKALDNAVKAEAATTATVNYLDVTAGSAEATALTAVKAAMKNVTVATGSMPTLEQIAAEQQILDAKAAATPSDTALATAAAEFKALVTTYTNAYGDNKLVAELSADQAKVTAATKAIEDFTKATTEMNKAIDVAAQLTAVNGSITGAQQAFVDNGMAAPKTVGTGLEVGTAGNDIYLVGTGAAQSIALFGLQGTDSLFIGSKYTLNTTAKLESGKITGGNDAVLEAFIFQDGTDTKVILEKSAFGSSAATAEVITITLTGVTSTEVTLSNGIITG